jgi:predicted phage terminase large subunit-like protein
MAYHGRVQIVIEQEPGSSGVDSVRHEIRMLGGHSVVADKVTGSKDIRLEPFASQAEAGNVQLKRGDWNGTYIDEMCAVPNGKYRDQADASGGAYNKLMSAGSFTIEEY